MLGELEWLENYETKRITGRMFGTIWLDFGRQFGAYLNSLNCVDLLEQSSRRNFQGRSWDAEKRTSTFAGRVDETAIATRKNRWNEFSLGFIKASNQNQVECREKWSNQQWLQRWESQQASLQIRRHSGANNFIEKNRDQD